MMTEKITKKKKKRRKPKIKNWIIMIATIAICISSVRVAYAYLTDKTSLFDNLKTALLGSQEYPIHSRQAWVGMNCEHTGYIMV